MEINSLLSFLNLHCFSPLLYLLRFLLLLDNFRLLHLFLLSFDLNTVLLLLITACNLESFLLLVAISNLESLLLLTSVITFIVVPLDKEVNLGKLLPHPCNSDGLAHVRTLAHVQQQTFKEFADQPRSAAIIKVLGNHSIEIAEQESRLRGINKGFPREV